MTVIRITRSSGIPLLGCLYFGVIDRGTSLLQVRPSCSCNLNCPFCSVDAGPSSRTRATSYEVECEYLLDVVQEIVTFKGNGVECHIDSPGEPLLYREIVSLVAGMKEIPGVEVISMQTNGTLLTEDLIDSLAIAGLDRINLSLHALDPPLSRELAGVSWYDIDHMTAMAERTAKSRIDLLIAPVYLPGINDQEIPRLIAYARSIGAGKRWPPLGIQKFERYRLGRTPQGVKVQSWWQFYHQSITSWEQTCSCRLTLSPQDFGTERRAMLPRLFRKGEKTKIELRAPGWLKGEVLGVGRERVVSVLNSPRDRGDLKVRMVNTKHNIYVAVPL